MSIIKKVMMALLTFLITILDGCGVSDPSYVTPDMAAVRQSEAVMEAVANQDAQALKELFSRSVSDAHDLDQEISQFLGFVEGEILSYDPPGGYIASKKTSSGETQELVLAGSIENIRTDCGRTYRISLLSYYICKEDEDRIGVAVAEISDCGVYNRENGFPVEGKVTAGEYNESKISLK